MPDDSCRNCGGDLLNHTLCAVCKDVVSRICQSCGTRTSEEFHDYCLYNVESLQTNEPLFFANIKQ